VKYRVRKARAGVGIGNIGSFMEMLIVFSALVGSWKITLSTEEVFQRNLCREITK
jgi:hypothetical protein